MPFSETSDSIYVQVGASNPLTIRANKITVSGNAAIGNAATDLIGFYGVTAVAQRAHADQGAVTVTEAITGSDTVDAADVLAAINALETLTNRMRADLVALGLIKGSA